jgi:hypothetical protein
LLDQKIEEDISKIILDDGKWEKFKLSIKKRGYPDFIEQANREKAKEHGNERAWVTHLYKIFLLKHIWDWCDYNPNPRRGLKAYSKKEFYDCTWMRTEGDELVKKTGGYSFNDRLWLKEFSRSSDTVLEEHTDRTKKPDWLDEELNCCSHYYIDQTKP